MRKVLIVIFLIGLHFCDNENKNKNSMQESILAFVALNNQTNSTGIVYSECSEPTKKVIVSTFAGSGSTGSTDGIGTTASFLLPSGITIDKNGNLFVADYSSKIRKITPGSSVTTVAGSSDGYVDGTGIAAKFYSPLGLTADSSDNIYVADSYNNRIRKITSVGVVTTIAGSGGIGSADGTGTAASFYYPGKISVSSSGAILVSDSGNRTIRKISSTGIVTTLAGSAGSIGSTDGTGSMASFRGPNGIVEDSSGNLFVADTSNNLIRQVSSSGTVTTFAGSGKLVSIDGIGKSASFYFPKDIAIDSSNNLYIAESGGHRIRKITSAGVVTTLAGNGNTGSNDGLGSSASFYHPEGVAVDSSGNVYVADYTNSKIRKISCQ